MANASEYSIGIWPGSSSFASGSSTSFGLFDSDTTFQSDADKFTKFATNRLGYPINAIEIGTASLYTCFEEAVSVYSSLVNQQNIKDNLLYITGAPTSSDLTHRVITNTFNHIINIAQDYGSEAEVGGNIEFYTGSISVSESIQTYDLNVLTRDTHHSGEQIEIKKVLHYAPPAIRRYFDPFLDTGLGSQNMLEQFGFGAMSPAVTYMMMPVYADLLRLQAIEFNDDIRKSAYSFKLINNKLQIFPIPDESFKVFFHYIVKSDRANPLRNAGNAASYASDSSNAPFSFMTYSKINSVGKRWIWDYGLACVMETLGWIRGKYSTIPIPGSEVTLNGTDLVNNALQIKTALREQMKNDLFELSKEKQMEKAKNESLALQENLLKIPLKIYIG